MVNNCDITYIPLTSNASKIIAGRRTRRITLPFTARGTGHRSPRQSMLLLVGKMTKRRCPLTAALVLGTDTTTATPDYWGPRTSQVEANVLT
ncbi:hypothetical protein Zmor_014300 [Zophobas morio]|uniref:Uncharacterized protein n=1 Tax=Zophobas morio TaxID=2755281 RepID=A0AA38MGC3_9CUCU|nr:hypothetical protein Zmor_014300 [Zophobas morio]